MASHRTRHSIDCLHLHVSLLTPLVVPLHVCCWPGHPLPAVRGRACRNLASKVAMGLISGEHLAPLVHHMRHLWQWVDPVAPPAGESIPGKEPTPAPSAASAKASFDDVAVILRSLAKVRCACLLLSPAPWCVGPACVHTLTLTRTHSPVAGSHWPAMADCQRGCATT